jgi:hypothetical protein
MPHSEGTLRVVTDVVVRQDARGNLVAISDQPRKCGDVVSVVLVTGALSRTPVRVVEVRPIVGNGSVRHWLRFVALEENAPAQPVSETR